MGTSSESLAYVVGLPSRHFSKKSCPVCPQARISDTTPAEPLQEQRVSALKTPIVDAIATESARVRSNFFCPGHKQGAVLYSELRDLVGTDVFRADLPELPALDNLFAPEGVIEESQRLAADVFTECGSEKWNTYFLVNGTTCGIEAAILSTVRPDGYVILPRNAHQSAVHGLVLSGATPIWIDPIYDAEHDLLHGVTANSVKEALKCAPGQVDVVLIISPTYYGTLSNVREIATIAHEDGARLIVDEAHGAHLRFHEDLPESATSCNADIVVQSTHKTLTAFTQAAMMHVRKSSIDGKRVTASLQLVQSTSPSYLLLASLDATRALMQGYGRELMAETIRLSRVCSQRIASLDGFSVLGEDETTSDGLKCSVQATQTKTLVYSRDPTRITVILPPHVTGYDIDTHLIDRFGVYAELPSFRHITFVLTPGTSQEDVDMLVASLSVYAATGSDISSSVNKFDPSALGAHSKTAKMTPRQAFFAPAKAISSSDAVGCVCAETLCPYPPGIPVLLPGEVITQASIDFLKAVLDAGGSVSGSSDDALLTIRVIDEGTI